MIYRPTPQHPLENYVQRGIDVGGIHIEFERTCRVPVGKLNSLPAGLGSFPVYKVNDFRSGCPSDWHDNSYFLPMYPQEAMWISFARGYHEQPSAMIIGAGNINAISGKPFAKNQQQTLEGDLREESRTDMNKLQPKNSLDVQLESKQNYIVVPPQPWIDGWKAEDGKVYQFVAAELGSGETVEGQITGEEKVGGIQFLVYKPRPDKKLILESTPHEYISSGSWSGGYPQKLGGILYDGLETLCCADAGMQSKSFAARSVQSMGLGRGGEIRQKIYPDPYGLDVWQDIPNAVEVFYLVSSEDFKQITGHDAPPTPVTFEKYQQYGLPWFDLHDQNHGDAKGSDIFSKLKPVDTGKKKK
jgi:hypothetical protein